MYLSYSLRGQLNFGVVLILDIYSAYNTVLILPTPKRAQYYSYLDGNTAQRPSPDSIGIIKYLFCLYMYSFLLSEFKQSY